MVASIATNCTRRPGIVGNPASGWIGVEVPPAVLSAGKAARAPGADTRTPSLALPARRVLVGSKVLRVKPLRAIRADPAATSGPAGAVDRRAMSFRQRECEEKRLLFKKGVSLHPAFAGTERERGALPCWST